MSQLSPFVRAFRALGTAFEEEAQQSVTDRRNELLSYGRVFHVAATDLEQQIAADVARLNRADAEQRTPRVP